MYRGRRVQQRLHDSPCLLDPVLAGEPHNLANHRSVQQHLVRGWPFAALLGKLHVEVDGLWDGRVCAPRLDSESDPSRRIEFDDKLARLRSSITHQAEAKPRRLLENNTELRLGDREPLASADEERHPRPAPVVDVEPQRGVRLGGRVGGDARDTQIALILPTDVVGRISLGDRAEQRDLGVLDRSWVMP